MIYLNQCQHLNLPLKPVVLDHLDLHHFEDSDYKDIFFLKNKQSTVKKCTKHSIFENIEKIHRYNPQGSMDTVYKITNPEEK